MFKKGLNVLKLKNVSKKQVLIAINDLSGTIFHMSGTKHGQEQHHLLDLGGSDINYANGKKRWTIPSRD